MKHELNLYLFFEFGVEGDEAQVTDSWPFELTEIGSIDDEHIFTFLNDDEEYYAIHGRSIRYESKDGADLELLRHQIRGARWIGSRSPVNLSTSRGEHPIIPMIPERRSAIERLAHFSGRLGKPTILEGLFLEGPREYLALIEFPEEDSVHVVGDSIRIYDIPKSSASPWKQLARIVGSYLQK